MRTVVNGIEDVFLAGWGLMLGTFLVIAPWWLGCDAETAPTWNAWACGSAVVVLSLLGIVQVYDWLEFLIGAAGLWLCAAPWLLGFEHEVAADWVHAGFGVALIISAGAELWRRHETPGARTV